MTGSVLQTLYIVLSSKQDVEVARKNWKLQGSTRAAVLDELSRIEGEASPLTAPWIATARLALKGDEAQLKMLEKESLKECGFPTLEQAEKAEEP